MALDRLAQIEALIANEAPEFEEEDVVDAIKQILEERKRSGEATATYDLQKAYLLLSWWFHDGRFMVANTPGKDVGTKLTGELTKEIIEHFPAFRVYLGPSQIVGENIAA